MRFKQYHPSWVLTPQEFVKAGKKLQRLKPHESNMLLGNHTSIMGDVKPETIKRSSNKLKKTKHMNYCKVMLHHQRWNNHSTSRYPNSFGGNMQPGLSSPFSSTNLFVWKPMVCKCHLLEGGSLGFLLKGRHFNQPSEPPPNPSKMPQPTTCRLASTLRQRSASASSVAAGRSDTSQS